MRTLQVRCSALPLAFLCAGSTRTSELVVDEANEAARSGSAAHEGFRPLVSRGRVDWAGVKALAQRFAVDEQELRILLAMGAKLWNEVRDSFPNAETEVSLSYEWTVTIEGENGPSPLRVVLTGHADALGGSLDTVHVGDWKCGRKDKDYSEQFLGYAVLALLRELAASSATATGLWVRDVAAEHYTLKRDQLQAWIDRFFNEVVYWDGTYRPGDHCTHCRRNHECPGANAVARRDIAIIADRELLGKVEDAESIRELARNNPDQLIQLRARAHNVKALAERFDSAIRNLVLAEGEIVGSKEKLTIEVANNRSLDPIKAFPVLQEAGFEDEDMARVIKMSAAKAEAVVRERAPRGKGAAEVRKLAAALEQAGAITTEPIERLVARRV